MFFKNVALGVVENIGDGGLSSPGHSEWPLIVLIFLCSVFQNHKQVVRSENYFF